LAIISGLPYERRGQKLKKSTINLYCSPGDNDEMERIILVATILSGKAHNLS
jgi:hypothetical protein